MLNHLSKLNSINNLCLIKKEQYPIQISALMLQFSIKIELECQ